MKVAVLGVRTNKNGKPERKLLFVQFIGLQWLPVLCDVSVICDVKKHPSIIVVVTNATAKALCNAESLTFDTTSIRLPPDVQLLISLFSENTATF